MKSSLWALNQPGTLGILSAMNSFRSGEKQMLPVDTADGESALQSLGAWPRVLYRGSSTKGRHISPGRGLWGLSLCPLKGSLNLMEMMSDGKCQLSSWVFATVGHQGSSGGMQLSGVPCTESQDGRPTWLGALSRGSSRSQTAYPCPGCRGRQGSMGPRHDTELTHDNTIPPLGKFQVPLKFTGGSARDKLRPLTFSWCFPDTHPSPISSFPIMDWKDRGCFPGTPKGALAE